jgi:hypothetical protein
MSGCSDIVVHVTQPAGDPTGTAISGANGNAEFRYFLPGVIDPDDGAIFDGHPEPNETITFAARAPVACGPQLQK